MTEAELVKLGEAALNAVQKQTDDFRDRVQAMVDGYKAYSASTPLTVVLKGRCESVSLALGEVMTVEVQPPSPHPGPIVEGIPGKAPTRGLPFRDLHELRRELDRLAAAD